VKTRVKMSKKTQQLASAGVLVGAKRVAEVLGISVRSVHRYAADGTLPSHRLGRRILFDPDEIAAVADEGRVRRKAGDEPSEEPVELPMPAAVIRERNGNIPYGLGAENLTVAELIDGLLDGTFRINPRRVTALLEDANDEEQDELRDVLDAYSRGKVAELVRLLRYAYHNRGASAELADLLGRIVGVR
jgi:excisionase family DNA binding protein